MEEAVTIACLSDQLVAFAYGPDEPAHLVVTVADRHGSERQVSFDAAALPQFAKMFRDLEKRFPGAFRGH